MYRVHLDKQDAVQTLIGEAFKSQKLLHYSFIPNLLIT